MNFVPIWASAIISFLPMHIGIFVVGQAMHENGPTPRTEICDPHFFNICHIFDYNGNIYIYQLIYGRCVVPTLEKFIKQEGGITLLQRIGLGNICSILAMIRGWIY